MLRNVPLCKPSRPSPPAKFTSHCRLKTLDVPGAVKLSPSAPGHSTLTGPDGVCTIVTDCDGDVTADVLVDVAIEVLDDVLDGALEILGEATGDDDLSGGDVVVTAALTVPLAAALAVTVTAWPCPLLALLGMLASRKLIPSWRSITSLPRGLDASRRDRSKN